MNGLKNELNEMDKILPGSEIIGLDPDDFYSRPVKKRLETLAHKASYLPETVRVENLERVENDSMDGITLLFVLHHIDEKKHEAIMQEIKRVLKPDGKLFIAEDLVKGDEEKKMVKMIDRKLNFEFSDKNPHCYRDMEEWRAFFENQGFRVVEVSEQRPEKVRHGFFVLEKRETKD